MATGATHRNLLFSSMSPLRLISKVGSCGQFISSTMEDLGIPQQMVGDNGGGLTLINPRTQGSPGSGRPSDYMKSITLLSQANLLLTCASRFKKENTLMVTIKIGPSSGCTTLYLT